VSVLLNAVRQAFDGGVDIQICLVDQYRNSGRAGDLSNYFQSS
jgi:hypothetical protein